MTKDALDGMPKSDTKGLKMFTDEHGNPYSIEIVKWKNVTFDPNANVRPREEFDSEKWGALALVPVLRDLQKPKTCPAFHLKGGKLTILRGNRRYIAYEALRKENPSEARYQFIEAHIYRDLPDFKAAIVKMDHSANEQPLSRVGLHLSIIECKKMGMSEADTIATLRGALSTTQSRDKNPEKPNDDESVFKQYRGFVRTSRWANDISVLEEQYLNKLRDPKVKFPTYAQIDNLHQEHGKDKKLNVLLTRETASKAPLFSAMWNRMVAERDEAIANGSEQPGRGTTKLTATQIDKFAFDSVINNAIKACVNRTAVNPAAWVDVIDPIMVRLEKFMSPEDRAALQAACVAAPVVETPAPVAEEKPTKAKTKAKKAKTAKV